MSTVASPPLITAVIANYNYACYLEQAIESALNQTYPKVEVIVIDDGSTDNSEAVLRSFDGRIRWIRQRNQGVSAARNRGIEESRGEFIAFMDADDRWHPEKLTRQMAMLQDPAVGMVYTDLQYVNDDGELLGQQSGGFAGHVLTAMALSQSPGVPASGSGALVRRACFQLTGLFDVELSTSADWDMWRRIACHYRIEIVREPLVLYRLHATSMHKNVDLLERDMLHAFGDLFADSAASEVHPLRRRCYGNLYRTLSGCHFHARRWPRCVKFAVLSMISWPPGFFAVCSRPCRSLWRRLRARWGDSQSLA